MPLPQSGQPWPIAPFGMMFDQYRVNAAWYEGNVDELSRIYTQTAEGATTGDAVWRQGVLTSGGITGLGRWARRWWNGQPASNGEVTRIHSPLAGNLASLSSDILFGEAPTTRLIVGGVKVDSAAQTLLDGLMNSDEAQVAMQRAGEYSAGIGAAAFSWAWDKDIADKPWMQAHAADAIIPEFRSGRLSSLITFDTYAGTGDTVWRHLQSHESGFIVHGLYSGKRDKLGSLVKFGSKGAPSNLDYIPGIANAVLEGETVKVPTGTKLLTAQMMLNLPTRSYRREGVLSNMGRADTEGAEGFLDAHDETWSSWLRDIKLARARLIVPDSFLEGKGAGNGAYFNEYAEVFTGLDGLSLGDDMKNSIIPQQFDIRWEAHHKSALAEVAEVLQHAGYNESSYGDAGGSDNTATEVIDRTRRTERTRDKKARYARMALNGMARAGLELHVAVYGSVTGYEAVKPENLEVVFPEVSQIDPEKQARTIQFLRASKALSIDTAIRMQHPDWDEKEIGAEVEKIAKETPDPIDPFTVGLNGDTEPADETPGNEQQPGDNRGGA